MLAFIGAHSLPLAAIALAGYLVLGAVMPIASSKLCGNASRASRDAAGSISAYVLDGLRGLAETVQFAGVSKRSAGLAAQTDAMGSTDRSLHVRSAAVEGLADALVLLTSLAMIATSLGLFAAGDPSFSSAFAASVKPAVRCEALGRLRAARLCTHLRARSRPRMIASWTMSRSRSNPARWCALPDGPARASRRCSSCL